MPEILLKESVPDELMGEILKGLYWISPKADNFRFDMNDSRIVIYDIKNNEKVNDVNTRIVKMIEDIHDAHKLNNATSKRNTKHKSSIQSGTYEELIKHGYIKQVGNGSYLWTGIAARLHKAVDQYIKNIASSLSFEDWVTPTIIDVNLLRRTGYLKSFPHHLHFLYHFPEEIEVIETCRRSLDREEYRDDFHGLGATGFSGNVLAPTVCCSVLSAFAGKNGLMNDSIVRVTSSQSCYRHEGRSTNGIHRLREFHMREMVVLGNQDNVIIWRDRLIEILFGICDFLKLEAYLESASDPFFLDDRKVKRIYQGSFDLKQEIRISADVPEKTIAGGSVNLHQDHFGKSFDFNTGDEYSWSCCAGFGIDRICYSIFSQFGLEPENWNKNIKSILDENL